MVISSLNVSQQLQNQNDVVLKARNLGHNYTGVQGNVVVLNNLNLELQRGQVLAVTGPSGSGKSTLLHLLGGLENASQGEVLWREKSLRGLSQDALAKLRANEVGFIFQHHYLLEDLSVLENVALSGLITGRNIKPQAEKLLQRVGLEERANYFPRTLSGGERQRVALARALAIAPTLVVADEPTGSLDRQNAELVFNMLLELARSEGAAVVVATHDEELAKQADVWHRLRDGKLFDARHYDAPVLDSH